MARRKDERYTSPYKRKDLPRKKTSHNWAFRSQFHCQTTLNGDTLDYWPTTHRWRFRGKTWYGDVLRFIEDKIHEAALTEDYPNE